MRTPHVLLWILLVVTSASHLLITAYAIFRSRRRAALPASARETYTTINPGTLTTPESLRMSPRASQAATAPETAPQAMTEEER